MKKASFLIFMLIAVFARGQEKESPVYWSLSNEIIFSFAFIDNDGNTEGNIMRWAPFINPQVMANYDFSELFGVFSGFAIRNVGFIYENPDDNNNKYKYRTYNFGIPVGFKLGKLDKIFMFGGYEIEFPFAYKEKLFIDEVKEDKFTVWFSDRVEPVQHSVLAGAQFPYGMALKFKYYFTNFHNRDFTVTEDARSETQPYDFKSNVFYFSFSWNLFTNWKAYDPKEYKSYNSDLR